MKKVLITGGAGYIGSTIASALKEKGFVPIILDTLLKGTRNFTKGNIFYEGDIADDNVIGEIFSAHPDIFCVIHCAALIVVPESVELPHEYYRENVSKTIKFLNSICNRGCVNVIFSSSASIYDDVDKFVVYENSKINARSPYARTKQMVEMVLQDYAQAYNMKTIALRYFNPIGADPKLRSGNPVKNPSHILGKLVDVAEGREKQFKITGTGWNTRDGSGLRDYIHVWDLAQAHVKAVENLYDVFKRENREYGFIPINIGTGVGTTVKEFVAIFENVIGKKINKKVSSAREGDVAGAYANVDKAYRLLDWKAELSIKQGIIDALRWDKVRNKILKEI